MTVSWCSYQTNVVNKMLATIVSIQPKDSGGSGGETRESVVYRLADDMLSKLPTDYVQHEVLSSPAAAAEFICHQKNMHLYINVNDRRAARKE